MLTKDEHTAVSSTPKKRGRPSKPHRTAWGANIEGLRYRKHDQRWVVLATGQMFREPDERLAVARFHQIQAKLGKANNKPLVPVGTFNDAATAFRAATKGNSYVFRIARDGRTVTAQKSLDTEAYWGWLRKQLIERPKWVAERVGIEQIGYLKDLEDPSDSPKLADLGELYASKPGLSPNEASRSRLFWAEFCKAVRVERVGDIGHDHVVTYEAAVLAKDYAPKSLLHRYRKVRTIFAYAIKRGRGVKDCRRALDMTAMLEVKDAHPLDPQPIDVEDFWAIHKQAADAGDETYAALMLTAVNAAMYGGEVAALKWEELDLKAGELVTRRSKTGVSRVAVLWPETIKALKKVERRGEYVFYSSRRSYNVNAVLKKWREYRTGAKLDESLTFSQIRDAGFTIACRGASLDQARVLAGHRLPGATDFYVRRNPQFVADACRAIRAQFYKTKVKASAA